MKTLLGIVASPRKLGNSELFIKELYRQLSGTWELKLVRLTELDIRPCQACYRCLFGEMNCYQEDDFHIALDALIQSDAFAVAAPTYFLGANASLKRFLDRGLNFYAHIDQLWGKPAVGAAIAGSKGMEGYTKLSVENFVKVTMGDLRGSAVIYGRLPGEIFLKNEGREIARRLGEALVTGKESNFNGPSCPLCGGDTFRFLSNGQVQCMLCSNQGYYEWNENHLKLHIPLGEHPPFLSYEAAKRHANLLREMKESFVARRKELKAITQQYAELGRWIQPRKNRSNGNQG